MSRRRRVLPPDATVADYPEVAAELHPDDGPATAIPARSGAAVRWICPAGPDHQWAAPPYRRLAAGAGCPACAGKQVSVTNSLAARCPEVAAELDPDAAATGGLSADQLVAGSHRRVGWRCARCWHRWEAQVGSRTGKQRPGCPACAGHVPTPAYNLAVSCPAVAAQWHPHRNGALQPTDVTPGSTVSEWWQCPVHPDHEWAATPNARTHPTSPTGCPACAGYQLSATNNLAARHPDLAAQLDPALNDGLTADRVRAGTVDKVTWRCPVGPDHVWVAPVVSRTAGGNGCPFCAGRRVSLTTALARDAALVAEFDLAANAPHTPETLARTSTRRMTWRCPQGRDHVWVATVASRAVHGHGCPYCSGHTVARERSLAVVCPPAAAELDPARNNGLTADQVSAGSGRTVTWSCAVAADHTWTSTVASRVTGLRQGTGLCPHCHPSRTGRSLRQLAVASALAHALPTLIVDPHPAGIRAAGSLRRVDVSVPDLNLLVEYDGVYFHRGRTTQDTEKADALRTLGWTVVRIREHDLPVLHPHDLPVPVLPPADAGRVVAALLEHLARALPAVASAKLHAARVAAGEFSPDPWRWAAPEPAFLGALAALEAFTAREGHALVPAEHQEGTFALGRWALRQRRLHRQERLPAHHAALLEGVPGWVWDWRANRWELFIAALRRYQTREGHLRVPQAHREAGYRLGSKVAMTRAQYRQGRLAPDRVAQLQALLGWEWAPAGGRRAAPVDRRSRHDPF